MPYRAAVVVSFALVVALAPGATAAAEPGADNATEVVRGRDLMTGEERASQRRRMRQAESEAERLRIRAEHHAAMYRRAREQGLGIPETMPAERGPKHSRGLDGAKPERNGAGGGKDHGRHAPGKQSACPKAQSQGRQKDAASG